MRYLKILLCLVLLLAVSSDVVSQPRSSGRRMITEEIDGDPSAVTTRLRVTNGTLACAGSVCTLTIGAGGGAPVNGNYIVQIPNGILTNEQPMSALATGSVWSTNATGIQSINANNTAFGNLAGGVDQLPYFTGVGTLASSAYSAYARGLVATVNEAGFTAYVNLEIGIDLQAWDTDLDTYATIPPSPNIQAFLGAATYDAAADLLLDNNSLAPAGGTWDLSNVTLTLPDTITLNIADTHEAFLRTAGIGNDDWFCLVQAEDDNDGSWNCLIRVYAEDSGVEAPYLRLGEGDGADYWKIGHDGLLSAQGGADIDLPANSVDAGDISSVVVSAYFSAGTPDGAQCADAASVAINSGPQVFTIICADNDGSTIWWHMVMPDSWDVATDITAELEYLQTAADTDPLNGDIGIQCRGAGETVDATITAEYAMDDAAVSGTNQIDHLTSGAIDVNSGAGSNDCTAGDSLWIRYQMDAGGTTTAVATLHFMGLKVEYTSLVGD